MSAIDIASAVLLGLGSLFAFTGGIGLLRLPDFFTRTHAAGLTDTAGAGLIILGLLLQAPDAGTAVRLLLILGFALFTGPSASHALAQAALKDGLKPLLPKTKQKR